MAKPILHLTAIEFKLLKKKVELEFGSPILSKKDCLLLSMLIQNRIRENISQSTIYRLFFHSEKHHPYQHTLDTIAIFCGYESISDLLADIRRDSILATSIGTEIDLKKISQNLLFQCVQNQEFNSISSYLESLDSNLSIENKSLLGYTIFQALKLSPQAEIPFYKKFASNPVVRECFFELMADPNFELPNYSKGLQLYVSHIGNIEEITAFQNFIFAKSLIARNHYLNNENTKFEKDFNEIQDAIERYEVLFNKINIFPRVRALALKIFAAARFNSFDEFNQIIDEIIKDIKHSMENSNILQKRIACYVILEALITTNCRNEKIKQFIKLFEKDFQFESKKLSYHQILDSIQPNGLLYRSSITT